jgi:hypothetical protein
MRNFDKILFDMEPKKISALEKIARQMLRDKEIIEKAGITRAAEEYGIKFVIPESLSHLPRKERK